MGNVRIRSRYDEEHMGYVWYLIVDGVPTQGYDAIWDAIVEGILRQRSREDKLDFLWDVAMSLARLRGGMAIIYYKALLDMFGEKDPDYMRRTDET